MRDIKGYAHGDQSRSVADGYMYLERKVKIWRTFLDDCAEKIG